MRSPLANILLATVALTAHQWKASAQFNVIANASEFNLTESSSTYCTTNPDLETVQYTFTYGALEFGLYCAIPAANVSCGATIKFFDVAEPIKDDSTVRGCTVVDISPDGTFLLSPTVFAGTPGNSGSSFTATYNISCAYGNETLAEVVGCPVPFDSDALEG